MVIQIHTNAPKESRQARRAAAFESLRPDPEVLESRRSEVDVVDSRRSESRRSPPEMENRPAVDG